MTVDSTPIQHLAQSQFAPVAQAYVHSPTHAHGPDRQQMLELAALRGSERVLDVATGGGHMALALAGVAQHVVASDLTLAMLHAAREHITAQGYPQLSYCRCPAEALPFAAASFALVTCRVAAHHFADIQAFVQESARVLQPSGALLVSDHIGLDDPDLDAFMDRFERWRDPSHVRAYRFAEWQHFCNVAGLKLTHTEPYQWEPYRFADWTARIRMPDSERDQLEQWLLAAEPRYRDFFQIEVVEGRVQSLRGTFGIIMAHKLT